MKMLIIKPSSLGDVIHALPFLKAVKDTWPDARVDWVINRPLQGILEDNPLINELIVIDKDSWKKAAKLPSTLSELSALKKTLKTKRYDIVVDLQGLLRSGLIAFSTPAASKVGFADAREGSHFFYDRNVFVKDSTHAVDKCLEVAKAIGAKAGKKGFPLKIDRKIKAAIRDLLGGINEYVVIVPSARWSSKRWPAKNFASLIKKIPMPCVITGSRNDRKISREITGARGEGREVRGQKSKEPTNIIDLCGRTDLKELTAVIAGAKAVVTNDSGPMHIAAALGRPVVAVFGPTDPIKTGPYNWQKSGKAKVIKANVSCSPCRKKRCEKLTCMHDININQVFKALKEYL
jgi:lipopolysaccharide heptosyltransferase I